MRILQVSTNDIGGGAEKVAWNLFQSYRYRGYASWLAVGHKFSNDSDVFPIPNHELKGSWARVWLALGGYLGSLDGQFRGAWRLSKLARGVAEPAKWLDEHRGIEDFAFPGAWRLLTLTSKAPSIVHFHNLHGGYFDLRVLPWLSRQQPVVLTLHDAWLLSGHCAHSLDCNRWKTGCGQCPDLTIPPAIQRDNTHHNWRRKQEIFAKSRFCVATPSKWLMDKVDQSLLASSVAEARVIANGVDLTVFHRANKLAARLTLGLPQDVKVLLFAGHGIRRNIWKDYETMKAAISVVAKNLNGQKVLFIALGEKAPPEQIHQAEVRFVPYQTDPEVTAGYYQAADVYIHAARADTFPSTILEALACGTPVVATAVGGIPEQVKSLWGTNSFNPAKATGIVIPPGEAQGMAAGIQTLLSDKFLSHRLADNAAEDAKDRFDLVRQVENYLEWYKELLQGYTRQNENN